MERVHDNVGSWEGKDSEKCMSLCVCTCKCEKQKRENFWNVVNVCLMEIGRSRIVLIGDIN